MKDTPVGEGEGHFSGTKVTNGAEPPEPDVASIVRAAAQGAEAQWSWLVDRYSEVIWTVARVHRLSREDAGDVVQTTWLRLAEHINDLRNPSAVRAWLITTARRECLRLLRFRSRETPTVDELSPPGDPGPSSDHSVLVAERNAVLWRAFRTLSERDQRLLRLLTADPALSYEEISAILGIRIGSIGPTRARALDRLRRDAELVQVAGREN
jgi:RNA polymerase sigma factor (sigma-70 family)